MRSCRSRACTSHLSVPLFLQKPKSLRRNSSLISSGLQTRCTLPVTIQYVPSPLSFHTPAICACFCLGHDRCVAILARDDRSPRGSCQGPKGNRFCHWYRSPPYFQRQAVATLWFVTRQHIPVICFVDMNSSSRGCHKRDMAMGCSCPSQ